MLRHCELSSVHLGNHGKLCRTVGLIKVANYRLLFIGQYELQTVREVQEELLKGWIDGQETRIRSGLCGQVLRTWRSRRRML